MANTAYEEALLTASDDTDVTLSTLMPSYMVAADTHNTVGNSKTFLAAAQDTIESIPRFIGLSLLSGANQIYNIAPSLGNLVGGDFEYSEIDDLLAEVDSDLARYYRDNKEGIDFGGFLLSAAAPGLGSVKALHMGQASLNASLTAGKFGTNTSKALGLLVPNRQKYLNKAISEAVNTNSVAFLSNRNTLHAIRAGLGQNMLEAAAFEIGVAATLFDSPILVEQDLGDLTSNIFWGGAVFGGISGAIAATKGYFSIKRAVTKADAEIAPWKYIAATPKVALPYQKIALDLDQIANIPNVPSSGIPINKQGIIVNASTLESYAKNKVDALETRIRSQIRVLADNDGDIAEELYVAIKTASVDDKIGLFTGLAKASRVNEDAIVSVNETAYARIWGEGKGTVFESAPKTISIADELKKGDTIKVTQSSVIAGSARYRFSKDTPWSVLETTPLEADARYIWAQSLPKLPKIIISESDIPMLERAYKEFNPSIQVRLSDKSVITFSTKEEFLEFVTNQKTTFANKLHESKKAFTQDEIASIVNVRSSYLGGKVSRDIESDIFARQTFTDVYNKDLVSAGIRKDSDKAVNLWDKPQHIKLDYDTSLFDDLDGHIAENMAIIKQQQRLYQDGTNRASAAVLGVEHSNLPEITGRMVQESANRLGSGPGFITAASSNPGTLAALAEYIGKVTTRVVDKAQTDTRNTLSPYLYKLGQNKKAAIEWATLSAKLRAIPDTYTLNDAGDAFLPLAVKRWIDADMLGEQPTLIAADAPKSIPITSTEVRELAAAHIKLNGRRIDSFRTLRTSQGMQYATEADAFYPPPVDPKAYPSFAIVYDSSITGTGHAKMIYAADDKTLEAMIAKLSSEPTLTVKTKGQAEEYWKAIGKFDAEKTLSQNYIDVALHRRGISSPYYVATDPEKIVSDLLNWHLEREAGLVREAVSTKYEVPFAELQKLGDTFTDVATSKWSAASLLKYADSIVKNPYANFIKTALGLRSNADYPWWVSLNRMVDEKFSTMYNAITKTFDSSRSADDLIGINNTLKQFGYKGAAYDAEMDIFANHTAPKKLLTTVVQKFNSVLATVVLRWDTLNAVNNAISANVLLGAEAKAVIRAIRRGDKEAIGELAELAEVTVPGTDKVILSPTKLISNSILKFGSDTAEMQFYKDHGYVTTISQQYRDTLDTLSVTGKESVKDLSGKVALAQKKLRLAADKGEKWTGNTLAEEFNRFVAADVMKQLTDIAVKKKYITQQEQLAYINTFVNRTQGNYLAAQRPMLFQGPIGQAIGLFQTYQFNLMQQLLRHVGEGANKDAMTLLGLQGTIHGLNGLPAFNAINTHIIGNASGNEAHRDAYDMMYGVAGKQAGNWLMYGLGSNMLLHPDLKVNLYVRGDINPRQLTVVPSNPARIPIVQASGKFFGNLFEVASKLKAGGDVTTTILQGLEHNGISRPLAGLAQTLEGLDNPLHASYSTSKRGNVIASNDLLSLANLGRIIGGKPLDEAIALDATFRFKAYGLVDAKRRRELGEAIKTTMIAGKEPTTEQIHNFAEQYAALGGRQDKFNTWFLQLYKAANLSQANALQQNLNSPFSTSMQKIMGGYELRDFID